MALVNHAKKEINAKIVYFGPAHNGKGTALNYIYSRIKPSLRGELKSVPAGSDNLLFFDFSPFETRLPNGYRFRLHIYTLTGIVTNPATWKMTLKGTDGIMIMVDPAAEHTADIRENISQLRDFLSAYGVGLNEIPAVLQLNQPTQKILPDDAALIAATLDLSSLSTCCTNSATGEGLLEALTTLSRQLIEKVTEFNEPADDGISSGHVPKAEMSEPAISSDPLPRSFHSSDDISQIVLRPQEVVANGGTIQIPLEFMQGDVNRRLVVTVNVALE